jgi:hypothetical protein
MTNPTETTARAAITIRSTTAMALITGELPLSTGGAMTHAELRGTNAEEASGRYAVFLRLPITISVQRAKLQPRQEKNAAEKSCEQKAKGK